MTTHEAFLQDALILVEGLDALVIGLKLNRQQTRLIGEYIPSPRNACP